ncbi:MAG: AbgT family transporter [Clostridiales bacterium]|nr:AbgT family transporter [Clostridiales bacterium]
MAANTKEKKAKSGFKMPHLFWIMFGLLFVSSLMTYIIPAGQFATDPETGKILGGSFAYLGYQTPVSPIQMMLMIIDGMVNSSLVGFSVMISGATVAIVMGTGAFDEFLNWAIYKLKDSNENILIIVMFVLMVYLGAFGGSDALIAIVPIGVMFAKKMKLDPISAIGFSTFATLLGFGTGPTKQATTQMMMGVPIYGTFFTMFISMNVFMIVGIFFVLSYVKKIRKDPTKSPMWSEGWRPDEYGADAAVNLEEVHLSGRTIAILIVYVAQYVIMVGYPLITGDTALTFKMMAALGVTVAVISGFIGGFSFEKIGNEFAKGLAGMAFVAFVIGLANVMSLILTQGNILHTIVNFMTAPLMNLPRSVASVGMTAVISVLNLLIPSASSKMAILVPILQPVSEALGMMPELAVQAFQYGDGFSNMVSPMLGWTIGSCVTAGVPFPKWAKWAFPKVIAFLLLSFVIMFGLTEFGWVPF